MLFLRPVKWHLSCLRSKRRGLGRRASDADKSKGARTAEVLAVVVVAGWGVAAGAGGRGSSQGVCECTRLGCWLDPGIAFHLASRDDIESE
ncbi:hypothetical protein C7S15_2344 [Burkholderia cepacia]|nr:hypothetical protein [Burkholderia cepacia]